MEIIDGNRIAQQILAEVSEKIKTIQSAIPPTIAFIRVGEDPASISYVNKKQKVAHEVGIQSKVCILPSSVSRESLWSQIDAFNSDSSIHGILIQAPLPRHLNEREAFNRVCSNKDVDGFNRVNLGKLCQEDESGFVACTPEGIVELLSRSSVTTAGKHVVILGRSLIVGKPAALLMLKNALSANATVTVCHSKTQNLASITRQADILIAAIGKPQFVKVDMVKPGVTIIDVGINRIEDASKKSGYRLVGDVDFDSVRPCVSKITPVPGGVGPMTVAILMRNTLKAFIQAQS